MPRKPKRAPLPPYCAPRPAGGYRLQINDREAGRRLSPRDLDPREPVFYETPADCWAAHTRLTKLLAERYDRGDTVAGFFAEWSDPDHYRWGKGRSPQSMNTYRSHLRAFVAMFGDRKLAAITPRDIDSYLSTRPAPSNIEICALFFRDAIRAHKRPDTPWENFDLDKPKRIVEDAPDPATLQRLLSYAYSSDRIPHSLYVWLLIGSEVGMRSGELDAMAIDRFDLRNPERPTYLIDRQYNEAIGEFTPPKWNSIREIALPPSLVSVIEDQIRYAERIGSPWLLTNGKGEHWTRSAREYYWRKLGDDSLRLRLATPDYPHGVSMYTATRAYFATQAVLQAPHLIPKIALHYGHKDKGVTLLKHYTRLTEKHGQEGMAEIYAGRPVSLDAMRRRKAA